MGLIVALVGLFFYIKFDADFKNNKTVKKEKHLLRGLLKSKKHKKLKRRL